MSQSSPLDRLITLLTDRTDAFAPSVTADRRISDLGIDSIDMAYILSTFEREHDVDFADSDFDYERYETVRDLAVMIEVRLRG
ncbi:acyl carrier protein [Micromonospora inyonensis]|uniref:Phosphopantetheine attachment site n=1 Tax=Micromonospora inyonensis TaxID=47866 RepID=A0A1C6RLD9_9ACTN|nr:acyl carrier protein [Micromonospora inyonensis]SCL17992.1 Phosphopantetheine attachment site [Micromonospora inyonensis]